MRRIEGGDGYIHFSRARSLFEKKRRAAATGKRSNATCMRDFFRFACRDVEIAGRDRTPRDKRSAGGTATINTVAVPQRVRRRRQHVARLPAETSSRDFHVADGFARRSKVPFAQRSRRAMIPARDHSMWASALARAPKGGRDVSPRSARGQNQADKRTSRRYVPAACHRLLTGRSYNFCSAFSAGRAVSPWGRVSPWVRWRRLLM